MVAQVPGIDLATMSHQHGPHTQAAAGVLIARLEGEGGAVASLSEKEKQLHFFCIFQKRFFEP